MAKLMGVIFSTGSKEWALLLFLLGGLLCGKAAGGVLYYHSDHTQSSTVVSDSEGDVLQVLAYSPFGEVSQISSQGSTPLFSRFATYEADPEAALLYAEARYYDPTTARFLSADPLRDSKNPSDLHLYAYAWWNPLKQIDPSGQVEEEVGEVEAAVIQYRSAAPEARPRALEQIRLGVQATNGSLDTDALKEGFRSIQAISDPDQRLQALQAFHQGLDPLASSLKGRLEIERGRAKGISFEEMSGLTAAVSTVGGLLTGAINALRYLEDSSPTGPEKYLAPSPQLLKTIWMAAGKKFAVGFFFGANGAAILGTGVYWVYYGDEYWEMYKLVGFAHDVVALRKEILLSLQERNATFLQSPPDGDGS